MWKVDHGDGISVLEVATHVQFLGSVKHVYHNVHALKDVTLEFLEFLERDTMFSTVELTHTDTLLLVEHQCLQVVSKETTTVLEQIMVAVKDMQCSLVVVDSHHLQQVAAVGVAGVAQA